MNRCYLHLTLGIQILFLGFSKDDKLITNWRMSTDNKKSADEIGMFVTQLFKYEGLNIEDVKDVIISSVVPTIMYALQHMTLKYFKRDAIVIGPGIKTGMNIKYDNPRQVGC